jgi:hypothetical protein
MTSWDPELVGSNIGKLYQGQHGTLEEAAGDPESRNELKQLNPSSDLPRKGETRMEISAACLM